MTDQIPEPPLWTTEDQKKLDKLRAVLDSASTAVSTRFIGIAIAFVICGLIVLGLGVGGPLLAIALFAVGTLIAAIASPFMYTAIKADNEWTELTNRKAKFDDFNKLNHKSVLPKPETVHSMSNTVTEKDSVLDLEQPIETEEQSTNEPKPKL